MELYQGHLRDALRREAVSAPTSDTHSRQKRIYQLQQTNTRINPGRSTCVMSRIFYAVCAAITISLAGFGIMYCVRTTAEQRLGQWQKVTNFFVQTTGAVKTYFTGLFAGARNFRTPTSHQS